MDIPLTPEQLEPVRQALLAGRKIEAIKLYRAATGTGLAEAKGAIEALEVRWRVETPTEFSKPAKTGCLGFLLLGGAGVSGVLHLALSR